MIKVNDENFEEINNSNDLIIIDFWGKWCSPCARFKEVIEDLENTYKDTIKFYSADIEENLVLRKQFKIMGLPTVIFLKDGEKVEHLSGFRSKNELENIIKKYI